MRSIINQNQVPLALPELRNLGTILRILLAVNALVLVAAVVGETRWGAISDAWMQATAIVEPQLLLTLLILYVAAPWLERLPYRTGAAAILTLTLGVGLAFNTLLAALFSDVTTAVLLRRLAFALLIAAALLYYFALRTKALSPAIAEARLQALRGDHPVRRACCRA